MAEIFPDEGLDFILSIFPKNAANIGTLYIGLFTSQTPSSAPARTMVLATQTGITVAKGTGYASQPIPAASWGPPTTLGSGRRITAAEVEFPKVGDGGWGTVNGFFLATQPVGGVCIFASNFDDLTATILNKNSVIKITPSLQFIG